MKTKTSLRARTRQLLGALLLAVSTAGAAACIEPYDDEAREDDIEIDDSAETLGEDLGAAPAAPDLDDGTPLPAATEGEDYEAVELRRDRQCGPEPDPQSGSCLSWGCMNGVWVCCDGGACEPV